MSGRVFVCHGGRVFGCHAYLFWYCSDGVVFFVFYFISKYRNIKEEWVIIKPSSSSPLAIVIEDMDIEEIHTCGYDYLALFNGKYYAIHICKLIR